MDIFEQERSCPGCYITFRGEGYKGSCSRPCHFMNLKNEKENRKHLCLKCNKKFTPRVVQQKYCSFGCTPTKFNTHQEKIDKANEKWLNPPPKKKPKYSLQQLNRNAEWKRVWDDESWTSRFNARRS